MSNKLEKLKIDIYQGFNLKQVDLSSCNLTLFPDELFLVKDSVEMMNFGGNYLSTLPDRMNEFIKLKILFFANNNFEIIPPCLGNLPSLYMISFKDNCLSFISLDALSSSIGWLILTNNKLTELPLDIGYKLSKLRKVMLAGNRLSTLPPSFSNCRELELLRLAGNDFHSLPSWLFTLPKLSWLALAGNPFCDSLDQLRPIHNSKHIDWNSLIIGDKLGEGAGGVVYKGKWNGMFVDSFIKEDKDIDVAVKLFKSANTSDGNSEDEMKASEIIDSHPNSVHVYGRIVHAPEEKLGLILSLIPSQYISLGNPPSFDTVTRDVYQDHQVYSIHSILVLLQGVASICEYLHNKRIAHGDIYAHNILIDKESGHPLLGDFGAATRYDGFHTKISDHLIDPSPIDYYKAFQGLEVRAFGCLVEDMIQQTLKIVDEVDDINSSVSSKDHRDILEKKLQYIKNICFQSNPLDRPTFTNILTLLQDI